MFKLYGVVGILMVLFAQLNFLLKIEPFASWYFPIIWFGYIFLIDATIYRLRGHSLISNHFWKFIGIVIISALFWWVFEFFNIFLQNWDYQNKGIGTALFQLKHFIKASISFATVLPAVFETWQLLRTFHFFDNNKLEKTHKITKRLLYTLIVLGIVLLILPMVYPKYFFPIIWLSLFFILDPINYLHGSPSIIRHLKDRRLAIPLTLFAAGFIAGFFWEFWNYWAVVKWTYNLPYANFFKVFEMPILGYIGYGPFAWELYAMYHFIGSLHKDEVKLEKLFVLKYLKKFQK